MSGTKFKDMAIELPKPWASNIFSDAPCKVSMCSDLVPPLAELMNHGYQYGLHDWMRRNERTSRR